jgi:hypothetical protein
VKILEGTVHIVGSIVLGVCLGIPVPRDVKQRVEASLVTKPIDEANLKTSNQTERRELSCKIRHTVLGRKRGLHVSI